MILPRLTQTRAPAGTADGTYAVVVTDGKIDGVTLIDAGGGAWTKYVDNALTATTGFSSLAGTWGAGSGQIAQTGTSAQYNRYRYDTRVMRALGAVQCEVRYDSGGTGATRAVGLTVGSDGTNNAVANLQLFLITTDTGSTWKLRAEANGVIGLFDSAAVTYTAGTYATLAAVVTTVGYEIYFDGVYKGLVHNISTAGRVADASYCGLVSYAATGTFRNLKVWGLTPPF